MKHYSEKHNNIFLHNALRFSLTILILIFGTLVAGCSSLNLEDASILGNSGYSLATQTKSSVVVSNSEYQRSLDAESYFHGATGTIDSEAYQKILEKYSFIQNELSARARVFDHLANTYSAFLTLVNLDASSSTESALEGLSESINGYANASGKDKIFSEKITGQIAAVGGLIASEVQKRKVRVASQLIGRRLTEFATLLSNPLIREQIVGFRSLLSENRKIATVMLIDAGVFDASPLINELGEDAGLNAHKNVMQVVGDNVNLKNGLVEIVSRRLKDKISVVESGYATNLAGINQLILEHQKLEQGKELDPAKLRELIAKLQALVELI